MCDLYKSGCKAHRNGFLEGDCCTTVRPVEPVTTAVDVESIDLTNRDWRARFFIFMRCIFITSSGRFHFGGVQPLSSSNMTGGTAAADYWDSGGDVDKNKFTFQSYGTATGLCDHGQIFISDSCRCCSVLNVQRLSPSSVHLSNGFRFVDNEWTRYVGSFARPITALVCFVWERVRMTSPPRRHWPAISLVVNRSAVSPVDFSLGFPSTPLVDRCK